MKRVFLFLVSLFVIVSASDQKDFTIEWLKFQIMDHNLEEIGLTGVWVKDLSAPLPEQYSVYWTEWVPDEILQKQAGKSEIVKKRKIQRFLTYSEAEKFFISKIQEKMALFKTEIKATKK